MVLSGFVLKIGCYNMRCTCISLHKDGSSSTKKKDLAFKASQEKRGKAKVDHDSSSDDKIDDASLSLMVRRIAKMHKKLNKNGVKFNGKKKKFFTSSRRKPISEMDYYNCGDLGHLAHQCPKPKKDKYKKKYKGKKDDSSDENDDEKKKNKPYKKNDGKKKEFHKKKNGKAYIVGDWLTDIESSSGVYTRIWKKDLRSSRAPKIMSVRD